MLSMGLFCDHRNVHVFMPRRVIDVLSIDLVKLKHQLFWSGLVIFWGNHWKVMHFVLDHTTR
jgi:hypothetical protein